MLHGTLRFSRVIGSLPEYRDRAGNRDRGQHDESALVQGRVDSRLRRSQSERVVLATCGFWRCQRACQFDQGALERGPRAMGLASERSRM